MNSLCIPIGGFTATIDDLQGTEAFQPTTVDMPIDMIMNMEENEILENIAENGDHGAS